MLLFTLVIFNVNKSLGGGDIWAAQPPLKLQKHSLFPGKSFSPLLYNMLWNLSEVVIKKI